MEAENKVVMVTALVVLEVMFKAKVLETFKMKKTGVAASLRCRLYKPILPPPPTKDILAESNSGFLAQDSVHQKCGLQSSGWFFFFVGLA